MVLNVLGATAIAVAIAIVVDGRERESERIAAIAVTYDAVRMIQAQLDVRVALESGPPEERAFPQSISPAWFEGERPANQLVGQDRHWVEVAADNERELRHPRDPTVRGGQGAMFWYNPALGIVRARVPRTLTDADALALYNQVNGTSISNLEMFTSADDDH